MSETLIHSQSWRFAQLILKKLIIWKVSINMKRTFTSFFSGFDPTTRRTFSTFISSTSFPGSLLLHQKTQSQNPEPHPSFSSYKKWNSKKVWIVIRGSKNANISQSRTIGLTRSEAVKVVFASWRWTCSMPATAIPAIQRPCTVAVGARKRPGLAPKRG